MTASAGYGNLVVGIRSHSAERIHIYLELLDSRLASIRSEWVEGHFASLLFIPAGVCAVRVTLPNGIQEEEIIHIEADKENMVIFNMEDYSPHEDHEWAYFTKNPPLPTADRLDTTLEMPVSANLWTLHNGTWLSGPVPGWPQLVISRVGQSLNLYRSGGELQVLEVSGPNLSVCHVLLPPALQLRVLVRIAVSPVDQSYRPEVTVATDNWVSEALLSLMSSGNMKAAKSLLDQEQVEEFLYLKVGDPVAAAVGGYFLLRTARLDQFRDWAKVLADLFPWLPDGAIISAWQSLEENRGFNVKGAAGGEGPFRDRLLQAVERGIPVYTEGLRLLHEGLRMLSYTSDGMSRKVESALKTVQQWVSAADWSCPTTTFINADFSLDDISPFPVEAGAGTGRYLSGESAD